MKTSDIEKMSASEKLQAIESLWDSLLDEQVEVVSPPWHEQLLKARTAKIQDGSATYISLEALKNLKSS
ncbi:MAG: addiction module protein [Cellvibrio sp.]